MSVTVLTPSNTQRLTTLAAVMAEITLEDQLTFAESLIDQASQAIARECDSAETVGGLMDIPVRLYRKASGEICETVTPGQSASLLAPAGISIPDVEAKRLGIADYLVRRRRPALLIKSVEQIEAENKAVEQDEVEDKGLMLDRSRVKRSGTP